MRFKPDKTLVQTLLFIITTFIISCLPLFLGFILKKINPQEYGLITGHKEDLEITYKEILFFASVMICFFLLSLSYRYIKNKLIKVILVSFAMLYLFAGCFIILVDVVYYLIFSCRITFSAIQTILNTNPEEAGDFILLYYSPGKIIAIVLFFLFIAFVILKRKWFVNLFSTRTFFIASFALTIFGIADFGQVAYSKSNGPHNVRYWDVVIGEYNEYKEFNRRLIAEKNDQNFSKDYDSFYNKDTSQKTVVLVVSESLSKKHMSLYGYSRKTTPNLDTNTCIYKFNNCVTQSALTIEAVPGMFFGYLSKKINLITLLNKLNYETSWISNQSGWGKGDRTIVLLSQLCKKNSFMDAMADNDKANTSLHYDEEVLKEFEMEIGRPSKHSKFIVLHLMGCHFEYEKRYPVNRNFFRSKAPAKTAVDNERTQNIINCYDNSMHYHDSIVNQIIKIFSKNSKDKNASLVFLSDHGEELYENRNYAGHGFPPTKVTAEIPYFIMFSDVFKKKYPFIESEVKKRSNTPYSTLNNFYTFLHLLNIDSKEHGTRIQSRGFFSAKYDSTLPRLVMQLDYSKMEH